MNWETTMLLFHAEKPSFESTAETLAVMGPSFKNAHGSRIA